MIRVVVADDSAIAREALTDCLQEEGDIRVVGIAADGSGAVRQVAALHPDVVTMDIQMPGSDGYIAIEEIMARHPVPIVVVSALTTRSGSLAMAALSRGALEVAVKPANDTDEADLRAVVRRVAGIPVVRHLRALRKERASSAPRRAKPATGAAQIVGIAASAGGPAALDVVLAQLPANLHACVALVQHLPPAFVGAFASYLRSRTQLEVVMVEPGAGVEARPGRLAIAAADHHLVAVSPRLLAAAPDPPLRGHRPSATLLFRSLARFVGDRAIGVILTGIGDDGAAGLAELRVTGALTIGQDEKTSTVYGMPHAAAVQGAVVRVLPLHQIAGAIRRAVGEGGP